MALANISVTPYGTAELVRLCLRDTDADSSEEESDDEDSEDKKEKGRHDEVVSKRRPSGFILLGVG